MSHEPVLDDRLDAFGTDEEVPEAEAVRRTRRINVAARRSLDEYFERKRLRSLLEDDFGVDRDPSVERR